MVGAIEVSDHDKTIEKAAKNNRYCKYCCYHDDLRVRNLLNVFHHYKTGTALTSSNSAKLSFSIGRAISSTPGAF